MNIVASQICRCQNCGYGNISIAAFTSERGESNIMLCRNCQREFSEEEAGTSYDRGEAWGAPYTVSYMCCPVCGSEDITDEYQHCDFCGKACEYYTETEDGEYYCEECYSSNLKEDV